MDGCMKRVVVKVPLLAIGGQFFLCCIAMYLVMLICSMTTLVSWIYVLFVFVSFTKKKKCKILKSYGPINISACDMVRASLSTKCAGTQGSS